MAGVTRPEPAPAKRTEIDGVLVLLRRDIPVDELDADDWQSLKMALHVVYETERLRAQLHGKRKIDRDAAISHWSDTLEACLEFMSWTKCLAQRESEQLHLEVPRDAGSEALWQLHAELTRQLPKPELGPGPRLCLLAVLGGIELTLLGQLWWLPSSAEPPAPSRKPAKRKKRG